MWILIVSLIALAVAAAIAGVIRDRRLRQQVKSGKLKSMPEVIEVDSECCGQHEVCEKESLLAAVSKKIERALDGMPLDGRFPVAEVSRLPRHFLLDCRQEHFARLTFGGKRICQPV